MVKLCLGSWVGLVELVPLVGHGIQPGLVLQVGPGQNLENKYANLNAFRGYADLDAFRGYANLDAFFRRSMGRPRLLTLTCSAGSTKLC